MSNPPSSETPYVIAVQIERRSLPLKNPYVLSFATLEAFEALLIQLQLDNGETRIGEVVPLPGYAVETVEDVLDTVQSWLPNFPGQMLHSLRQSVSSRITSNPFASSLILSAIDSTFVSQAQQSDVQPVPLVYPTASTKPELEQVVRQAIVAGYRTIKVKIGDCLEQDLAALPRLQRSLSPGVLVRFDANQGYSLEAARSFLQAVEIYLPEQTELVEQPLPPDAWDDMAKLASNTSIPLMLDESIYTATDVDRAADVGCQWVKLKLCKQGGVQELVQIAEHAKRIGLKTVIGNGVATDIINLLELQIYRNYCHLFDGASESNGFVKLQRLVSYPTLQVESGCAVWKH